MLSTLWNTLLFQPLINLLILLYQVLGHNLGWAIIALTAGLRLALIPLTSSSMKAAKRMQELAPEIARLKVDHKDNQQALAQAQMDLYRREGINPAAGCLPQIVQIIILIALFNAFSQTLHSNGDTLDKLNQLLYSPLRLAADTHINTQFFGVDLGQPNTFRLPSIPFALPGVLVILAAITQFISSKMMLPAARKAEATAAKTPESTDDMATAMQTQMLYMFPLMTLVIGVNFPAGLALYWLIFSVFTIIQQLLIPSSPPLVSRK